jgi:hypothetical protein
MRRGTRSPPPRRVDRAARLAIVVLTGLAAIAPSGAAARRSPPAPARLLVDAQEWSLWPSRAAVASGPVSVQLSNRGQDPHNLRIQALRHGRLVGRVQGVATTDPGQLSAGSWRLAPGTYELYCSLAGHAHAGMRTRLTVR